MKTYLYWSLHTGQYFNVAEDEVDTLDAFNVRLKSKANSNCKKCFGRFYSGKNLETGLYVPCRKCYNKCIDFDALLLNEDKEANTLSI